jgi:hypothetical protein
MAIELAVGPCVYGDKCLNGLNCVQKHTDAYKTTFIKINVAEFWKDYYKSYKMAYGAVYRGVIEEKNLQPIDSPCIFGQTCLRQMNCVFRHTNEEKIFFWNQLTEKYFCNYGCRNGLKCKMKHKCHKVHTVGEMKFFTEEEEKILIKNTHKDIYKDTKYYDDIGDIIAEHSNKYYDPITDNFVDIVSIGKTLDNKKPVLIIKHQHGETKVKLTDYVYEFGILYHDDKYRNKYFNSSFDQILYLQNILTKKFIDRMKKLNIGTARMTKSYLYKKIHEDQYLKETSDKLNKLDQNNCLKVYSEYMEELSIYSQGERENKDSPYYKVPENSRINIKRFETKPFDIDFNQLVQLVIPLIQRMQYMYDPSGIITDKLCYHHKYELLPS